MERKIITVNEFQNVARNNEYFLWHFLQKNQEESSIGLYSYFEEREGEENKVREIMDTIKIPYFESYVEDSIDFLHGLGIPYDRLWSPITNPRIILKNPFNQSFNPVLIGFNKFTKVLSTMDRCYCVDGIMDVILELNPEFLTSVNTED
jgi:hypothetical protein